MILWLLACSQPTFTPSHDPTAYVEATRLALTDPDAAAERCLQAGDDALISECIAQTAFTAQSAAVGSALCERATEDLWREECHFLVAEAAVAEVGPEQAVRDHCSRSGRFRENCVTHVWRLHATALIDAHGLADAALAYAPAKAWAEGTELDPDSLDDNFWGRFYEGAAYGEQPLDLASCEAFPEDGREACVAGVTSALKRAVTTALRDLRSSGRDLPSRAFCIQTQSLAEQAERYLGVRYVPSEALDAVVGELSERRCK